MKKIYYFMLFEQLTIFLNLANLQFYCRFLMHNFTTIFVDTWLCKTKHPRKRFQNFHQSWVLLTDRIEIHQLQPLVWPSNLLYIMLSGCDWWISIGSVNNTQYWRKFWKLFCGCFVFQSCVSTKMVLILCSTICVHSAMQHNIHYMYIYVWKLLCVGSRLWKFLMPWDSLQGKHGKRWSLSALH